jgi:uncharacterized protein YjaG (DUF416 family)
MLEFDERQLKIDLASVPKEARVAFAAACAERLAPAYKRFAEISGRGAPDLLSSILARLWADLQGVPMTVAESNANIRHCMALVPTEEDGPWIDEQAAAEDHVSALLYALTCLQGGDPQEAAWSAQHVYDALDSYIQCRDGRGDTQALDPKRVLADPLVQAELNRQRRDLDELMACKAADLSELTARLRDRAQKDGSAVFGTF